MKNLKLNKKTYMLAFIVVTILNVVLAGFLLRAGLAQISDKTLKNQPPVKAEVLKQDDSPALITVINVDNSEEKDQTVKYSVQNVGSKKIRAYVLVLADKSDTGKVITNFFQSFEVGKIIQDSISEARVNIKSNTLFLSLDYIEFEDGSSWGKDIQKQSEYLTGYKKGQRTAIDEIKSKLNNRNNEAISNLLKQEISEINPPNVDTTETVRWQNGFTGGYRFVLLRLQFAYEKRGIEAISSKLDEIEKFIKKGDK